MGSGWGGKSEMDALQNITANPIVDSATRNALNAAEQFLGLQSSVPLEQQYTPQPQQPQGQQTWDPTGRNGSSNPQDWDPAEGNSPPFGGPTYGDPADGRSLQGGAPPTGTTGAGLPVGPGTGTGYDRHPDTDIYGRPSYGGVGGPLQEGNPYEGTNPLPNMPLTPEFYPGQTVAGMNDMRSAGLQNLYARGAGGSSTEQAMSGFLGNTLAGGGGTGMLMSGLAPGQRALGNAATGQINPMVGNAFRAAAGDLTEHFNEQVMPGINATFAQAGRTGGGLHGDTLTNAAGELSDTIGGMGASMYGNAAESALDRQLAAGGMLQGGGLAGVNAQLGAAGLVPNASALDYQNLGAQLGAGQGFEDYDQSLIDAARERYEHDSTRPLQDFQRGMDSLSGYVGLTGPLQGTGTTSSSGSQQNKRVK